MSDQQTQEAPRRPILTLKTPPPSAPADEPPKKPKYTAAEKRAHKAARREAQEAARIAKKIAAEKNVRSENLTSAQAAKARRNRNYQFARKLAATTPVFDHTAPKPLAIGIMADVQAALECGHHPAKMFMAWWTRKTPYQRALAAGGPRYGLDGAEAGSVTAEQMAIAAGRLAAAEAAAKAGPA